MQKIQTKSKKVNKAWLHDHLTDPYVKLAQKEGYRARAAYKLKEIDEALHLIKPGQLVVDLGATPGAWSQYLRRKFAPKDAGTGGAAVGALNGTIIALDILRLRADRGRALHPGRFPRGRRAGPAATPRSAVGRSTWWCPTWRPTCRASRARTPPASPTWSNWRSSFRVRHLKPEGALVCKVFHGSGYSQLAKLFKDTFRVVKPIKPKASRDKSAETFLVGIGLKTQAQQRAEESS